MIMGNLLLFTLLFIIKNINGCITEQTLTNGPRTVNILTDSFENTSLPSIIIKLNVLTYGISILWVTSFLVNFENRRLWTLDGNDMNTIIIIENKFFAIIGMWWPQIKLNILTKWHQWKQMIQNASKIYSLHFDHFALSAEWDKFCWSMNNINSRNWKISKLVHVQFLR